jgi:hypothetical protein
MERPRRKQGRDLVVERAARAFVLAVGALIVTAIVLGLVFAAPAVGLIALLLASPLIGWLVLKILSKSVRPVVYSAIGFVILFLPAGVILLVLHR